jgi:SAM-dependent methyltransferase
MDNSFLVRIIGYPATLVHGDPLVLDRWLWLKQRLPKTANREYLLDVGCGSGAFTIGAAKRGYESLGLSWDLRNQTVATLRANLCQAPLATFEVLDVRHLDTRKDLVGKYDVAVSCENIEHILNDFKLIKDIVRCLKPGGHLLLTAPNYFFSPITSGDSGPFPEVEDGSHMRRGYSKGMLQELCHEAGLICEEITFCSGFLSQKITFLLRILSGVHPLMGWVLTFPLRLFPPFLDRVLTNILGWPYMSICLVAYKPRKT